MQSKYSDWLTKQEAAQKIGVSVKTVERLALGGKLQQKMRPRPGGTDVAVFHPGDVEREASERATVATKPFVIPNAPPAPTTPADSAIAPVMAAPLASQAETFAKLLGRELAQALAAVKPSDQIFTPAEAAVYAKRSVGRLRELRQQGKLENAGSEGRVLYRRADLDKL